MVAPLDIQALSATGRDGDFLIAKAAYSLRSLGTRQATLAATGDTVARADGKYVCQVRRSSDDAVKSFTATEVTDGTLLAFVNEIQTLGTVSNSAGNDGFTLTNTSSTGFTATTDTATGVCGWPYTAKSGDKIIVSFDAVIRSGTPQFIPRKATALSGSNLADVVSDSARSVNSTNSYLFEFTYDSDEAGSLTFSEGDDNADFDISNFKVLAFKGAGLVETWYDQSGNSNDVEQATASRQPKIVNSGSLVTDANGHPELDFASDFLSKTAFTQGDLEQPNNTFTVAKLNTNDDANRKLYDGTVGNKRNMLFLGTVGSGQFGLYSQIIIYTGETATNDKHLFSGLHNGASSELFINSVSKASGNTGAYSMSGINIAKNHSNDTNFWGGQIQELIIYNSNQSSNRVAIENNINNHYSIY